MPRECRKGGSTFNFNLFFVILAGPTSDNFQKGGVWAIECFCPTPPPNFIQRIWSFLWEAGVGNVWPSFEFKMLNFLFLLVRTAVIQLNLVVFYLFSIFYYYFTCQPSVKVSCLKGLYSIYFLHTKSLYSYIYVSL